MTYQRRHSESGVTLVGAEELYNNFRGAADMKIIKWDSVSTQLLDFDTDFAAGCSMEVNANQQVSVA